jgi:hypothetical protein
MSKLLWIAGGCVAFVLVGAFALAQIRQDEQSSVEKMLSEISAKIDRLTENQAKLNTIEANQQEMIKMLRIMRRGN